MLWGFDVLGGRTTLHFLGPAELGNRRRPGIQVHPSSLGCDDAVQLDGVWCTPPARTACDVVRLGPPIDGLATLDARCARAAASGRADRGARQQAGLRQVVRLRSLVPLADGRADSPMESRMRWRFIDGGLPAPDLQIESWATAGVQRWLDIGWREQRVGAEFDGLEAHMTARAAARTTATGTTG